VAEATTSYDILAPATDLWRRSVFLDDRFVVLFDRVALRQPDGADHEVTHQLHTNCGGDSGGDFASTTHGAVCERQGARLQVVVVSPQEESRTSREDVHDAWHWDERTHTVLETHVSTTGDEDAGFLTVLVPEPVDDGEPLDVTVTAEAGGEAYVVWGSGYRECEAWTGTDREVRAPNGTLLVQAGSGAWCGDQETLVGWFGGLDDGVALTLRVELDADAPTSWRAAVLADDGGGGAELSLPAIDGAEPDGACAWEAEAVGRWRMPVAAPQVIVTRTAARAEVASLWLSGYGHDEPLAVPLGDTITLDAGASCGASEFSWSIDEQPEMSALAQPEADAEHLSLQPALPGLYTVSVTLDGGADTATLSFELVGETTLAGGDDDDSAGPDDDDDTHEAPPGENLTPDGCGCRVHSARAGAQGLLVLAGVLAAGVRRRTR